VYVNRVAAEIARRRPGDLVGKNVFEVFPTATTLPFNDEVRRAMAERRPTRIEVRIPGTEVWLESRIVPTEEGLSAFTREVTDRKVTHRQLGMTLAALARSNQELERFARTVVHELVQPLGSMTMNAELVKQDRSEADIQQHANRIIDIGHRMAETLRSHLKEARSLSGSGTHETIELDRVLAEVQQELSGTLAGYGSVVTSDGLPVLEADPTLLRQLVYSLILSVLADGTSSRIRFSSRREGDECMIALTVARDAAAVPETTAPTGVEEGDEFTIARRIIELYGGTVRTEVETRSGLSIHFTLPTAIVHSPGAQPSVSA
jgi:light-regulated signal transduction histidine kinase (bacteriophytochrome)